MRLVELRAALRSPSADAMGITEVRELAPAVVYERRLPALIDDREADDFVRARLQSEMTVRMQTHPATQAVLLTGAIVVGQGTVITRDFGLIVESVAEFLADGTCPDGLIRGGDGTFLLPAAAWREVTTASLLAKRPWYRNFGHWLVDGAALLALCRPHRDLFDQIVVGHEYNSGTAKIVAECCAVLAPGVPIIAHRDTDAWQFRNLRYVLPVHVPPLTKLPAAVMALAEAFRPAAIGAKRRLFLTRRGTSRQISNLDAIGAMLTAAGFEEISPEHLSLAKQAQMFAEAEVIVGVKGASLTNLIFASPECRVIVLSPADFADPFFWDIAGQKGMMYAEVFGRVTTDRAVGQNDFAIDPAALRAALAAAGVVIAPAAPGPREFTLNRGGNGASCLGPGWSQAEDHGTWTMGRESIFVAPGLLGGFDYLCQISLGAHVHPPVLLHQDLLITARGVRLFADRIVEPRIIRFDIPAGMIAPGQDMELVLHCSNPTAPETFADVAAGSSDSRVLGFWVWSVSFAPQLAAHGRGLRLGVVE